MLIDIQTTPTKETPQSSDKSIVSEPAKVDKKSEFKDVIAKQRKKAAESSKKNIKVVFKFRGGETNTENLPPEVLELDTQTNSVLFEGRTHRFSQVLGSESTQFETYQSCKEVIQKVIDGFNGTIFVYGNSGSGKTYTMLGPDSVVEYLSSQESRDKLIDQDIEASFGVILRACAEIFEMINNSFEKGERIEYKMNVQYFEIYMEKIFDLVNYTGEGASIKQSKTGEIYLHPMTSREVSSPQDVCEILAIGQKHKKMSATHINDRSSRSHTIFLLEVIGQRSDGLTKKAKLNLIDLAGSEKYKNIGSSQSRLKESTNINKSLHHLSNCIKSLSEGQKFVSFRDSKLTHYLKDTLSGNSNTVLICTGSFQKINQNHTKMTIAFATRAQMVKTKPVSTTEMSASKMLKQIKILKQENFDLRVIIQEIKNGANSEEVLRKYSMQDDQNIDEQNSSFVDDSHLDINM